MKDPYAALLWLRQSQRLCGSEVHRLAQSPVYKCSRVGTNFILKGSWTGTLGAADHRMAAFFVQVYIVVTSQADGRLAPFLWGRLKDEARGAGDAPKTANPQARLSTALPMKYRSTTSHQGGERTLTSTPPGVPSWLHPNRS